MPTRRSRAYSRTTSSIENRGSRADVSSSLWIKLLSSSDEIPSASSSSSSSSPSERFAGPVPTISRRGEGESADEHGQAPERSLLGPAEELVAPLDRGPQRAVPVGRVPRTSGEQAQGGGPGWLIQPFEDGRRREELGPGGCELDGQRQPSQAHTDFGDGRDVVVRQSKVGPGGARPLHEQPDRRVGGQVARRRRAAQIR
jgi:hypothetical protein